MSAIERELQHLVHEREIHASGRRGDRSPGVKPTGAVAQIPFRLTKNFLINLGLASGDVKTRPSERRRRDDERMCRDRWGWC